MHSRSEMNILKQKYFSLRKWRKYWFKCLIVVANQVCTHRCLHVWKRKIAANLPRGLSALQQLGVHTWMNTYVENHTARPHVCRLAAVAIFGQDLHVRDCNGIKHLDTPARSACIAATRLSWQIAWNIEPPGRHSHGCQLWFPRTTSVTQVSSGLAYSSKLGHVCTHSGASGTASGKEIGNTCTQQKCNVRCIP